MRRRSLVVRHGGREGACVLQVVGESTLVVWEEMASEALNISQESVQDTPYVPTDAPVPPHLFKRGPISSGRSTTQSLFALQDPQATGAILLLGGAVDNAEPDGVDEPVLGLHRNGAPP